MLYNVFYLQLITVNVNFLLINVYIIFIVYLIKIVI